MPNKKRKGFRRTVRQVTPKRPTKRKQWTEDQMLAALDAVIKDGLSGNRAAALHGVPPSTLKDRLSGRVVHGRKPGPAPYLTSKEEKELSDHLILAARSGFGKTRRDVMNLVEGYMLKQQPPKSVNLSNGWWYNFKKRNPNLSLRSGDSTSTVRMNAVNPENVNTYFDLLEDIFDQFDFYSYPETIYNMDETGMPLEPRPPKIVARKGQKKIRYQTSGQKQQITVIGCGNATGQAIPPFVIFAAKQVNYLWTKNEVPGTRFAVSDKGWIDQELFYRFLTEHFMANVVSRRPILLLLDGHSTHFELRSLQFAKENNIIIFCLPPHTTHVCQPLDCSLFKPLKEHWRQECHKFYQKNPGSVISKFNFCKIFQPAWLKAIAPSNIVAGFKKAGIFPLNRNVVLEACVEGDESLDSADVSHTTNSSLDSSATMLQTSDAECERGCDELTEVTDHYLPSTLPHQRTVLDNQDNGNCVSKDSIQNCSGSKQSDANFTNEEELKYARRFEEGYDLFDARYEAWLQVNHPEAANKASTFSNLNELGSPLSSSSPQPVRGSSNLTQSEPNLICTTAEQTVSFNSLSNSEVLSDILDTPVDGNPPKEKVTCRGQDVSSSSFVADQISEIDYEEQPPYFTIEEELKYAHRYEEGYDLFDAHYQAWLQVNHPQDTHMAFGHGTSSECLLSNVTPIPDGSSTDSSQDSPSCAISKPMDEPNCNSSSMSSSSECPLSNLTPLRDGSSTDHTQSEDSPLYAIPKPVDKPADCNSLSASIASKVFPVNRSPLSDLLNIPVANKPKKKVNTGRARVLTSTECLKALQDKENLKQQKAEEKMRKQQERILKKQQKEEEIKRKKEEKIRKNAIKEAQSRAKGNRKQCSTNNATECVLGTSGNVSIPNHTRNLLKRRIDGLSPRRPNEKRIKSNAYEEIDTNQCCVCFGRYEDDAGTGREWLECCCTRWIHEDCIDNEDVDVENCKLCPLC